MNEKSIIKGNDIIFGDGNLFFINRAIECVEPHLHTHDFLEIAYVASGEGSHIIEGKEYDVSKGDLFVINYNVRHSFKSLLNHREKLIIYNCIFKPEFLDYTLINCTDFKDIAYHFLFNSLFPQETKPANDIKLIGEDCAEIEKLYIKMFDEYSAKNSGYVEILRAYLIELLVTIFRKYQESSILEDSHQTKHRKKELIEAAMLYMQENYDKDIKLDELSMLSFFSRNYFCKLFKETSGITVVEYIQRIRIQNACRLLKETNYSVQEISNQVGYEDSKFFTKIFKRYTGHTPGAFRKKA